MIPGAHLCRVSRGAATVSMQELQDNDVARSNLWAWAHEIFGVQGLTEHVIAVIMRDVLSALAYLHKDGIIHRDLKVDPMPSFIVATWHLWFTRTISVMQHASVQMQTSRTNTMQ